MFLGKLFIGTLSSRSSQPDYRQARSAKWGYIIFGPHRWTSHGQQGFGQRPGGGADVSFRL